MYDLVSCGPPHPQHPQRLGRGTVDRDMRFNIYVYMHMLDTYIIYIYHICSLKKIPASGFQMLYVFNVPNGKSWCLGSQQGPTVDLHIGSIDCQPIHFPPRAPLPFNGFAMESKPATKPVGRVQMCIYKQNVHTNAVF